MIEAFRGTNPLDGIDLPSKQKVDSESRTHEKPVVREFLLACRNETIPARRWFAWLITYSGARTHEIAKLKKEDVKKYEGCWYFHIQNGDSGSTKNRPRRVPLHRAVIAEGFLEFVAQAPDGLLFPGKWAAKDALNFAHSVVDFAGKPPYHGLRHLFEDLAIAMEDAAAKYIEGRALQGSGKDYGKSEAMVPELAEMMNRIEPLLPIPESK